MPSGPCYDDRVTARIKPRLCIFASATIAVGAALAFAGPGLAQNIGADPFAAFADEIAAGLETRTEAGAALKIAIIPFAAEIPINPESAEDLNRNLRRSLLQRLDARFSIINRSGFVSILAEYRDFGRDIEALVATLQEAALVDLLIEGTVRRDGARFLVGYHVIQVANGEIIAETTIRIVPVMAQREVAFPLRQAIEAMAAELADAVRDLTGIRMDGILFEDSLTRARFAPAARCRRNNLHRPPCGGA